MEHSRRTPWILLSQPYYKKSYKKNYNKCYKKRLLLEASDES